MVPNYFSTMWTAIAPALGNHLWQSTLVAGMAGLLTLLLRKNRARARYWLWLAASVKFLIPFSLLVAVGSHLAWSLGSRGSRTGLYFAMEEVGRPFTQPTMSMVSRTTPPTGSLSLIHLLPVFLAAVWLCGFVAVILVWLLRWRRISLAVREAVPLRKGRETEMLQRLGSIGGAGKPVEILLSRTSLEPGIFGIARPVLIWPEGISERLEDAHLEAILAHELWHLRRRDNLAAAVHMLVEAIFWFYPLVWWLGARLVAERERACDEEVLELGTQPQLYAESILKICEFCVGSPLACVSGVTGADLKKRMVYIMTKNVARNLDFSRKLLLSAAGFAAIAVPIMFGLLNATPSRAQSQDQNTAAIPPAYEDVSIKSSPINPDKSVEPVVSILSRRDTITTTNFTLHGLIRSAYGLGDDQISGGPSWINSERYDIEAKIDKSVAEDLQKLSPDQRVLERKRMLQALLTDRFKLTLHRESKELPVYELTIANSGSKLQEAKPGDTYSNGLKGPGGRPLGAGIILFTQESGQEVAQAVPIATLVMILSKKLGNRIVVDKTGLTGKYDFTLRWPSVESQPATGGPQGIDSPESSASPIFKAIQDQLGLRLVPQRDPVEVLVIDHAEQPAQN
jgi:bla regulator protein BlaR1